MYNLGQVYVQLCKMYTQQHCNWSKENILYFLNLCTVIQWHSCYKCMEFTRFIKCCIFKAGRVNLLCRVHVDTTILCNRNHKVKYVLLFLYKLLRKRNVVTLKPCVCRHSKGTARKLVDIIPTIISLINILITQLL